MLACGRRVPRLIIFIFPFFNHDIFNIIILMALDNMTNYQHFLLLQGQYLNFMVSNALLTLPPCLAAITKWLLQYSMVCSYFHLTIKMTVKVCDGSHNSQGIKPCDDNIVNLHLLLQKCPTCIILLYVHDRTVL